MRFVKVLCLSLAATIAFAQPATAPNPAKKSAIDLAAGILKADYRGERATLLRLFNEMEPLTADQAIASRVHYWRGFAMWRRAINGYNDSVDPKELQSDLLRGVEEFHQSISADRKFADSKVGATSCLMMLAFSFPYKTDIEKQQQQKYIAESTTLLQDAYTAEPNNPRMLWVRGGAVWYTPVERGGGQQAAIAGYEKGLKLARAQAPGDGLDPVWGEPELLMSLSWSHLNQTKPDLNAAEEESVAALKLVPDWHYVRDILLLQIRRVKP